MANKVHIILLLSFLWGSTHVFSQNADTTRKASIIRSYKDSVKHEASEEKASQADVLRTAVDKTTQQAMQPYSTVQKHIHDSVPAQTFDNGELLIKNRYQHVKDDTAFIKQKAKSVYTTEAERWMNDDNVLDNKLDKDKLSQVDAGSLQSLDQQAFKESISNKGLLREIKHKDFSGYPATPVMLENPSDLTNRMMSSARGGVSNTKRIYSQKYWQKVYDSIGSRKMDSLILLAASMAKKEVTPQELMESINRNAFGTYANRPDTTALFAANPGNLVKEDLSKMQLPNDVKNNLPPLNANEIDAPYLDALDSLRSKSLSLQRLSMEEQTISDNVKATIIKEKPRFWDNIYFDGVVGVLKDEKFTIVQVSPSLGYRFTNGFSVGLGPTISISQESRKFVNTIGLRSFVRMEVWNQRAYLQVEDNAAPAQQAPEQRKKLYHAVMIGGGCLLHLTKTTALNPSILYKINHGVLEDQSGSPWVIRLGISSISKK